MKYNLIFDRQFKKDLNKLERNIRERILKKVFELEKFPEIGKHLIGIDIWSLRIGKYRTPYKIEHNKGFVENLFPPLKLILLFVAPPCSLKYHPIINPTRKVITPSLTLPPNP